MWTKIFHDRPSIFLQPKSTKEQSRQQLPLHIALLSLTKPRNLKGQPLGLLGKQQSLHKHPGSLIISIIIIRILPSSINQY